MQKERRRRQQLFTCGYEISVERKKVGKSNCVDLFLGKVELNACFSQWRGMQPAISSCSTKLVVMSSG